MSTIIRESNYTVWYVDRTWTEPRERLRQQIDAQSYGAPTDPKEAGRMAVDALSDDLRKLADS